MRREYLIHLFVICSLIVFGVTYFMVDRIMLRAVQLGNNSMDVDFSSRSLGYASGITLVFALIFWLFVKDVGKHLGDEEQEE